MKNLFRDIAYSTRALRKTPSFTVVAILTIALGIGASTAIFSVVNAVLLKPLPYSDAERLVLVWGDLPRSKVGKVLKTDIRSELLRRP